MLFSFQEIPPLNGGFSWCAFGHDQTISIAGADHLRDADTRRIDATEEQLGVLRAWMLSGRDEPQP
jgi:hypothetical protein